MRVLLIGMAVGFMLCQCKPEHESKIRPLEHIDPVKYSNEVKALNTVEKQAAYLKAIYELDQGIRKSSSDIITRHGHLSDQHIIQMDSTMRIDIQLLAKIEAYLCQYGYPQKMEHGDTAVWAPWIVLHHSYNVPVRQKYFKHLYQATKYGHLDLSRLTFYLQRTHNTKFGHRIDFEGPFTNEQELDTLVKALDLVGIKDSIDIEFDKDIYR